MLAVERLMRRGFETAKVSGASLSPFVGKATRLPSRPDSTDPSLWQLHVESVQEALAVIADTTAPNLGPQILMIKARGAGLEQMAWLVEGRGPVVDERGRETIVQHSYSEGLTPKEMFACVAGARRGLARILTQWEQMGATFRERNVTKSFSVLTRALRARHPGLVFARAAAGGEVDPLVDVESRMLVGMPIINE